MEKLLPADAAQRVMTERYPGAVVAILAGSVTTGRATATSDLDLIVVSPDDPDLPYRESFVAHGWPVEAFIHDEASIEGFFRLDASSGDCSLATMISTGVVIFNKNGSASRLRDRAQTVIDAGPPALTDDELRELRYAVTDLLDDLIGDPTGEGSLVVGPALASKVGTLMLVLSGSWRADGKGLLHRLREATPNDADELVDAMRAHQGGHGQPLIALTERVLDASGGRMFDGYRASGRPLLAVLGNEDEVSPTTWR